MKKRVLLSLFLLCAFFCISQSKTTLTDSPKQDSNYVISLNDQSRQLIAAGSLLRADSLSKKALSLSEKINFKIGMALSLNMLGQIKQMQGEYGKSLEYFFKGLHIAEEIKDKQRASRLLSSIASTYLFQNNYQKAQDYYLKSLKIEEELNNKIGIARAYANIGTTYKNRGDSARKKDNLTYAKVKFYPIALDYFFKSLAIAETLGEERGIEVNLGNIGGVYLDIYEYDKALDFFQKSLMLSEKHNDKEGSAIKLYNIGNLVAEKGDSARSLSAKKTEYEKALVYLQRSLKLSQEAGDKQGSMLCHKTISHLYSLTGEHNEAFKQFKNYIVIRDSLFNEENTKKTVQLEMTYEFDKKEAAAKLEQQKKEALAIAESKKQKIIIFSVCGILLLVIAFAIFAYRSFLQKQKANIEILKQKQIIEEKQKEILDSIRYAKRIQAALLPSEKYIERNLKGREQT